MPTALPAGGAHLPGNVADSLPWERARVRVGSISRFLQQGPLSRTRTSLPGDDTHKPSVLPQQRGRHALGSRPLPSPLNRFFGITDISLHRMWHRHAFTSYTPTWCSTVGQSRSADDGPSGIHVAAPEGRCRRSLGGLRRLGPRVARSAGTKMFLRLLFGAS